jgi:TPR repeat protein
LVKLERLEIILFNAFAFFIRKSKIKATNAGRGCSNLGFMYEEGKGVKQDDFKALKFYQKSCDLNDGKCFEIILFNALAFFIHKSKKRATTARIQTTRLLVKLECFEIKACGLNAGNGCSNLGFMYKEGKGVKQDDFKALKFYRLEQPLPAFKPHAFW